MYKRMYFYACVLYMYAFMNVCKCVQMYVSMYVHVYMCICVCICVCVCVYVCVYMCVCVYICVHMLNVNRMSANSYYTSLASSHQKSLKISNGNQLKYETLDNAYNHIVHGYRAISSNSSGDSAIISNNCEVGSKISNQLQHYENVPLTEHDNQATSSTSSGVVTTRDCNVGTKIEQQVQQYENASHSQQEKTDHQAQLRNQQKTNQVSAQNQQETYIYIKQLLNEQDKYEELPEAFDQQYETLPSVYSGLYGPYEGLSLAETIGEKPFCEKNLNLQSQVKVVTLTYVCIYVLTYYL